MEQDDKSEEHEVWNYVNRDCKLDNEVMNYETVTDRTENNKSSNDKDNETDVILRCIITFRFYSTC